jgi:predicted glutamine amidotransferase
MCRLFGMLSARDESSAEEWLVRSDRSLLAQSHASPDTAQKDGWGVGWFADEGRARVVKGTHGAFEEGERERFTATAKEVSASLVLGHLRHASNPLNLPREQLLGPENSQPFEAHTTLFAHNGSIPFPTETRPMLGTYEPRVVGVNDSEVLFWLLTRNTHEHNDPLQGYVSTVADLYRVWEGLGRPAIPPFSGLNVLYSRGPDELWAFCQWTGDHGGGLLDPTRRYYEMTYAEFPHQVIVGSEPFDEERGRWRSLRSGTYLHAWRENGHVRTATGSTPIPPSVELQPPPI